MTPRPKPPARAKLDLVELEKVGVVPVEHVPIIVSEVRAKVETLKPCFDEALATGKSECDGRIVRRLDAPPEAATVDLPSQKHLFVSFRGHRPQERWLPVCELLPQNLNGFRYIDARRWLEPPSEPVRNALEAAFGHEERRGLDTWPGGSLDAMAKKMLGVTPVTLDGRIEVDGSVGSASMTQWLSYQGSWLPFRVVSKLIARRAEREMLNLNYNPEIKIP